MINDEERLHRVMRVADLAESGMSVRNISKYLTENEFKISVDTILKYITRIKDIDINRYNKIKAIQESNKPKTVRNSVDVQKRVKRVVELLVHGCTIDEIAIELDEKPLTIYRDIRKRVNYLTPNEMKKLGFGLEELEIIDKTLEKHSRDNLKRKLK